MYPQTIEAVAEGFRSIFDFKGLIFRQPCSPGAQQDLSALGSQTLDVGRIEYGGTSAKLGQLFLKPGRRGQVQHLRKA